MASESDKIKYSDFADEGSINKLVADLNLADGALKSFEETWKRIKDSMKSGAKGSEKTVAGIDTNTVKGVKDLNAEYEKHRKIVEGISEVEKKLLVIKEKSKLVQAQNRKDAQFEAKEQLGLITQYDREQKLLGELILKKKQLGAQTAENGEQFHLLSIQIDQLDQKLKTFDDGVGRHQRHVGDYQQTLKNLGGGLGGTIGLFAAFGKVLGIDTEAIERMHETSKGLVHATREFTHATHLSHLSHEEHAEGVKHDGEEIKKLSGIQKIWNFVVGESTGAMKLLRIAIAGTGIGLLIIALGSLYSAWQKNREAEEKLIELTSELREANRELEKSYEEIKEAAEKAAIRELESIKKVLEARQSATKKTVASLKEIEGVQKEINEKEIEEIDKRIIYSQAAEQTYFDYVQSLYSKREAISRNNDLSQVEKAASIKNIDIAIAEYYTKVNLEKKNQIDLRATKKEALANQLADKIKFGKEVTDVEKQNLDELARLSYEASLRAMKQLEQEEIALETLNKKEVKQEEDKDAAIAAAKLGISLEVYENQKKLATEEAILRNKRIDAMIAEQEQIVQIFDKGYQRRYELMKKASEYETSLIDSEIQQQSALAQAGQSNHLDETLRAKADNIAQQKQLDKKAAQEKEALDLVNVFFGYEQAYLKSGDKDAQQKAFLKTIESKAIAEGIQYAFAEEGGILGDTLKTDYKLFSKKHKGEEVIVQAQKGEAFVSLQDMAGLKRGIIPAWLQKIYNPGKDGAIGHSMAQSLELNELRAEISEFTKAIKERPAISIQKDLYGNIILAKSENGRYKNYIQAPPSNIVERNKWQ